MSLKNRFMDTTEELLKSLALETIEHNIFRGHNHDVGSPHVFGGQVLSQSLDAAIITVPEDRVIHSFHAYFILPGNLKQPIVFEVERLRDGGSFTTRRVTAIQKGQAIFIMAASFQLIQPGFEHQIEMPDVTPPDELKSDLEILQSFGDDLPESIKKFNRKRPIEFRPVNPFSFITPESQEPFRHVWFKANGEVPNDQNIHRRLLTYASDYNLLTTAVLPHQDQTSIAHLRIASLDHAMWFHHDVDFSQWLLYALDSPSASNSRGFTRGNVFTQDGKLVASVAQEGLMRKRRNT